MKTFKQVERREMYNFESWKLLKFYCFECLHSLQVCGKWDKYPHKMLIEFYFISLLAFAARCLSNT